MARSLRPKGQVVSGCCRTRSTSLLLSMALGSCLGSLGSSSSAAGLKGMTFCLASQTKNWRTSFKCKCWLDQASGLPLGLR